MKNFHTFISFLWMCVGFAQPHIQVIQDGAGVDHFVQHSMAEYSSGIYIVAGTIVEPNNDTRVLVVKTDDMGNILWSNYISYTGEDSFVGSLIVDKQQNIVLTGYKGVNGGHKDLIVVKLDGNGNLLDEAIIEETWGYGLYGFDLVETNSSDYLITGMGTAGPTATAFKYGFVLHIDNSLSNIFWGKKYQSIGGALNYNSFNHILKVSKHPSGQELYLLTGTGSTVNGDMMVTNDLIDISGTSIWGGAVGYNWTSGDYIQPGVMALYQIQSNQFWVMSYGAENMPVVLRIEGNGNNGYGAWHLHNHFWGSQADNINLINGMEWVDASQSQILLSGYHIQPTTPAGQGWPMLVNLSLVGGSNSSQWVKYQSYFDGLDFQGINFDFIVQPINYVHPNFPFMLNQLYYQPKSLAHNFIIPDHGPQFVEPYQRPGEPFGTNFLNTRNVGRLTGCIELFETNHGTPPTNPLTKHTNFVDSPHAFKIISPLAIVASANVNSFLICGAPAPKPMIETNQLLNGKIEIYPNPTSDWLYVSNLSGIGIVKITLHDMQGKKVLSEAYQENQDKVQLDISGLQKGVYFLKIYSSKKNVFVERIIKE